MKRKFVTPALHLEVCGQNWYLCQEKACKNGNQCVCLRTSKSGQSGFAWFKAHAQVWG